jgi:hypothetical protein
VTFEALDDSSGGEGSGVDRNSKSKLNIASNLLGITSPDWFERALTITLLKDVRGSFIARRHSPATAADNRDAICKEIYNRTFNWLVKRINDAVKRETSSKSENVMVVGILDIFGFEIFESNSFEQLCINFANEKLQQHFNSSTFKEETAVYKREGIDYDEIVFIDNEDVISLVGHKGGIFHQLDEEIKVPRGSSKGFYNKLVKKFTGGTNQHKRLGSHKPGSSYFTVKHYAGDVKYDYNGFLEKNKDTLFNDLIELVSNEESCSNTFVRSLFPSSSNSKKGGKLSVSKQFRSQLDSLMSTLNECSPHYIRCIKANSVKKPDIFMGGMILEQLKYSGVFEAVEIRRSGYPCRRSHSQFRHRYWMLADRATRSACCTNNIPMKKQCQMLINVFGGSGGDIGMSDKMKGLKLGKTMVLYKADQQRELEQRRMELVDRTIRLGQKICRGAIGRMLIASIRKIDEYYSNAINTRNLDGSVQSGGCVEVYNWLLNVEKRCELKRINFNNRFNTKPNKIVKLSNLIELMQKERIIHNKLIELSSGNPLDNYDELVTWTAKANELHMSKYDMYSNVLVDASNKRDAVSIIAKTKKHLSLGLTRNDSNGLNRSILKAKELLISMNGSLPHDYFDPHLTQAIEMLPTLKKKDDITESDVISALKNGGALMAQIESNDSNTINDIDPSLISTSKIDTILTKYNYNPLEMEIMGGGGSSSANAGNTIEFLLNNEKLPCYSNNCLLRLLLIRRCRVALMNNKFKTLNSILDNENERIEKLFNEHSIRDSISIGEEELKYISDISLTRAIVPELENAIQKGRPNLSLTNAYEYNREGQITGNRDRSLSTSSNTSNNSNDSDDSRGNNSPPSSPSRTDSKLSSRVSRLRRLSFRKEKRELHDYEEKARSLKKEVLFPHLHGCPCFVYSREQSIDHIYHVLDKASALKKPSDTIKRLLIQAKLVIDIRIALRNIYEIENDDDNDMNINEKNNQLQIYVKELNDIVTNFSSLNHNVIAEPALHDIYVARCELKFRLSLNELKNSLSIGSINGTVGHLNINSGTDDNDTNTCRYEHFILVLERAKTIRTSYGYNKHSLYMKCVELLLKLRKTSIKWLTSPTKSNTNEIITILENSKRLGLHPTTYLKFIKEEEEKFKNVNINNIIKSTVDEVHLVQMELHNQSIITLCRNIIDTSSSSDNYLHIGGPSTNDIGSVNIFNQLDSNILKDILDKIQNVYGGCKTNEAKLHRNSIFVLMNLRMAVLNMNSNEMNERIKWKDVSKLIENEKNENQLLDIYLNEFHIIQNERNNSIMCSEMLNSMKNNTCNNMNIDTVELENAIDYATKMIPISKNAKILLLIAKDLLHLRLAVQNKNWDQVEMYLRSMHDQNGNIINIPVKKGQLKGIEYSKIKEIGLLPINNDSIQDEIKYIVLELNNVRMCTYIMNALQENRYVGVDRNVHYDSTDDTNNPSSKLLGNCKINDLKNVLQHSITIGPPKTKKCRSLYIVAELVVHIREKLMNFQFEGVYTALRPIGGYKKLLKIVHVDDDDDDVKNGDEEENDFTIPWPDIISQYVSSVAIKIEFSTDDIFTLSNNDFLKRNTCIHNEIIAARNEAEHNITMKRLIVALENGSFNIGEIGELNYMLATSSKPNAGIKIKRLQNGIALSNKCHVESKSSIVKTLTYVARKILQIRKSMITQNYDEIENLLFQEEVHGCDVPSLFNHLDTYSSSAVEHCINKVNAEIRRCTYELWNYRTNEYLVNSMNEDGVSGTIGHINLDTIETIHLERSLIYAQDRLVGNRCVSTKNLMLLADSVLDMRKSLINMNWKDVNMYVQLCEERYLQCSNKEAENDDNNELCNHRKEVQLVKSELRHREIVTVLSDALSSGGPTGSVGSLDVNVIQLVDIDNSLVIARKLIEEEISSIGGDDDRAQDLSDNSEFYDNREGLIVSELVARLISLASKIRRLRASMKAKTFDVAEKIVSEIENNESITTIDTINDIDTALFRPPSLPSSTASTVSSSCTLLSVTEVQSCRLELNDMNMCNQMIKALNDGKVGTNAKSVINEIGVKFIHGEGNLSSSLSNCELLGGCQSPRAINLRLSVEHVLVLRKLLYDCKWDDFRIALKNDLITSTSEPPSYAKEAKWEIHRCVQESDHHEACISLVAAVTTSGPSGVVGNFDISSVSSSSLTKAIDFCFECETRDSASQALIELRNISQILLDLRSNLLNDSWTVLRSVLKKESRRNSNAISGDAVIEAAAAVTRNGGSFSLNNHVKAGIQSCIAEISFIEKELHHRILLSALLSSLLEGYPRGTVGKMDVNAVEIENLSSAIHLSSGGTMTDTYACETNLSKSLRRIAILIHAVRTSLISGNWEGVKKHLDNYNSIELSDEERNITVREVFTSLRRSLSSDDELDVIIASAEINFITKEWENCTVTNICRKALQHNNISGVVGLLNRSEVSTNITQEALSIGDDLFLGSMDCDNNEYTLNTHTERTDKLLRSVRFIHQLRTALSNSYIVSTGDAPLTSTPRKDEINALNECIQLFLKHFPVPTTSGIHILIHITKQLDFRCHDEVSLVYDHVQDGIAKIALMNALGKGGPTGSVGAFNGSSANVHLLESVLNSTNDIERKSNDVNIMRKTAQHVLNIRKMLQNTVRISNSESGGWEEWHNIETMLQPTSSLVASILESFQNRLPDIQADIATLYDTHINEMEYIQDEIKHRTFIRIATRALCCHRLSGEIGNVNTNDIRLDLLDEAIEWHDKEINKVTSKHREGLSGISGWTTDLSSSLCRIVRHLRTLRCCVMEGEWGCSTEGNVVGGTVSEECSWWYPERGNRMKPNVISTKIRAASSSIKSKEEYVPVTLQQVRQALEGLSLDDDDSGSSSFRRFLYLIVSNSNDYSNDLDDVPELFEDIVDLSPTTELSSYEVNLIIDEDDDRQNLFDMITALHRGGPLKPWVVGSLDASAINNQDLQKVLRRVVHRGNSKSPKANALRLTCLYMDHLRLAVSNSDWSTVAKALITKIVPNSSNNEHNKNLTIDLNKLSMTFIDVQSALQSAQSERDFYANELADRMVRESVRKCMTLGQPTGAVGAIRWDSKSGNDVLIRLEDAVRQMELFVQYGTSQNGTRIIPNAGPAGDQDTKSSTFTYGSHCSPKTVKLLKDGQKLIQLRRALSEAISTNINYDEEKRSESEESKDSLVMNRHKKWKDVILPITIAMKANECPSACLAEVDLVQKEANHRISLICLWKHLTSGYPSGKVGAMDTTTVDVGGLRTAYDDVTSSISTQSNSSSITCQRLCTMARAILELRASIVNGDWSEKTNNNTSSSFPSFVSSYNEDTSKSFGSSNITVSEALGKARKILINVGGMTEGTLVAAGIPQAILRQSSSTTSGEINGSSRIIVVPTDELNFVSEENDDRAMCKKMVAALIDEETRIRGTLGHMRKGNHSNCKDLINAVEYAEKKSPKSMRARGLVRSCRVIIALRTACCNHDEKSERMHHLKAVFTSMSGETQVQDEAWDEILRYRAELKDYSANKLLLRALHEGRARGALGMFDESTIDVHICDDAIEAATTNPKEHDNDRNMKTTDRRFSLRLLLSSPSHLAKETTMLLNTVTAIRELRISLSTQDWVQVERILLSNPLFLNYIHSVTDEKEDYEDEYRFPSAPPAVPKDILHKDAHDEIEHAWREWRHRLVLKSFKVAVDAYNSPTDSDAEKCKQALSVFNDVLNGKDRISNEGNDGKERQHWIDGSEFARRMEKATTKLLKLREACGHSNWKDVVEMTEIVANKSIPRDTTFSRDVRYNDLCRALRLDDSLSTTTSSNGDNNKKTSNSMLPVGWIEMKETRIYALEQMFLRSFQEAVESGQINNSEIVVGSLSERCHDVKSVRKALEFGEMAGYHLDVDSEEEDSRFMIELQTLILLLRLRGAVLQHDYNLLNSVLLEERTRLSSSLASYVHPSATTEILLLEADDRDHIVRKALRRALLAGVVLSSGGNRSRVVIDTPINLRPLDHALSLVSFIVREEVHDSSLRITNAKFVLSSVTQRLIAVARLCRALRASCKLSRWPRDDIDVIHESIKELTIGITEIESNDVGESPHSGIVDEGTSNINIKEVIDMLVQPLKMEVKVLLSDCNYHCASRLLLKGAIDAIQDNNGTSLLEDSVAFTKDLLKDANNVDLYSLWNGCSQLITMYHKVNDSIDWTSIGIDLAPNILRDFSNVKDHNILITLKIIIGWVKFNYQEYSTRETSISLVTSINNGIPSRNSSTGLIEFGTCNVNILKSAINSTKIRSRALKAAGIEPLPIDEDNNMNKNDVEMNSNDAYVLFSGADKRCTLLIQSAMTTLSLRKELHNHEDAMKNKDNELTTSSWNKAVAIAKQACTSHSFYHKKTLNNKDNVGSVPELYLKEMNDVLKENIERDVCKDLQSTVVNGRITGLPGYLDIRYVRESLGPIRTAIRRGKNIIEDNINPISKHGRLNELLNLANAVLLLRESVLEVYFTKNSNDSTTTQAFNNGTTTSWGSLSGKTEKERDLKRIRLNLNNLSNIIGCIDDEIVNHPKNRHVRVNELDLSTLQSELKAVTNHVVEDELRFKIIVALKDKAHAVQGVVGHVKQNNDDGDGDERDTRTKAIFEVPKTSIVDLTECVALARKYPPSSSDVVELVKCAKMIIKARSLFQRSQWNDVVEYLTPSLINHHNNVSDEASDVEQIELHLPNESRIEVELMRSHALYRSLVNTFWNQVEKNDDVSSGYDSVDIVSKLKRGAEIISSGKATGSVGTIDVSTINTSAIEVAIGLLSSSHERIKRFGSESSDSNNVSSSSLSIESIRLKNSFEILFDLRRSMIRRDWDAVRQIVSCIDLMIEKERRSRTGVRAIGTRHVPLLSCSTFVQGELLLARRECEDRQCRRILREGLSKGCISGNLNDPNYGTIDVIALKDAIRLCTKKNDNGGNFNDVKDNNDDYVDSITYSGVHTDICRQLLETAKGILDMRLQLSVDTAVNWLGVESALGRMRSMGMVAWEIPIENTDNRKRSGSNSAPRVQGFGKKGRRASVVLSSTAIPPSSSNPYLDEKDESVDEDMVNDHKALIFSAGEREFVNRLCQDYRMTTRLEAALSTGAVVGSPGSLDIVGRVKTADLESALDLVLQLTGQTNNQSNYPSRNGRRSDGPPGPPPRRDSFLFAESAGKLGILNEISSSGEDDSDDSDEEAQTEIAAPLKNNTSTKISSLSSSPQPLMSRTSSNLVIKESRLSHRVSKLQKTAKIVLMLRRSLLSTPIKWGLMRNAMNEADALGSPKENYLASVSINEINLMSEILSDHDIVESLRTALEGGNNNVGAAEQTKILKKTIARGKKMRRQSVSMQLLMKSANAVVTLQTGKNDEIEDVLANMDMEVLSTAINATAITGSNINNSKSSPMVTKLLSSAKMIHRLHSTRSMKNWDMLKDAITEADHENSLGHLTDKASKILEVSRESLRRHKVEIDLVNNLIKGSVSGTIDAIDITTIEHGQLDQALQASNLLIGANDDDDDDDNDDDNETKKDETTKTKLNGSATVLPHKLKLYIKLAKLTRELRMAFLCNPTDWKNVSKLCTEYDTLTSNELNDVTKVNYDDTTHASNGSDSSTGINIMSEVLQSIQPTVNEFIFARASSHHYNIIQALNKALSTGGPIGDVGHMDTSTIRTRELETTLRQILDTSKSNKYGGGPQCASAAILVQWATTVLDLRYGLIDNDIGVVEEVLERASDNNNINSMFKSKGIHKIPNNKGGITISGCPTICLPELTASRDELWHWKVRDMLRHNLLNGGPKYFKGMNNIVGYMDCGTIRVRNLKKAIDEAKNGTKCFLTKKNNYGLSDLLNKNIVISDECSTLIKTCEIVYMIRNALRNGNWINAEKYIENWNLKKLDTIATEELISIEMEIEDRHVIECLELYVLSSGSTSRTKINASSNSSSNSISSVYGVLLDGLKQALQNIKTNGWTPRSSQAKGLYEAGQSLASIYSAFNQRNWTESLSLLNSINSKSSRDHWSSMLWDETWQNIRYVSLIFFIASFSDFITNYSFFLIFSCLFFFVFI